MHECDGNAANETEAEPTGADERCTTVGRAKEASTHHSLFNQVSLWNFKWQCSKCYHLRSTIPTVLVFSFFKCNYCQRAFLIKLQGSPQKVTSAEFQWFTFSFPVKKSILKIYSITDKHGQTIFFLFCFYFPEITKDKRNYRLLLQKRKGSCRNEE